jgi:hypothetical protein
LSCSTSVARCGGSESQGVVLVLQALSNCCERDTANPSLCRDRCARQALKRGGRDGTEAPCPAGVAPRSCATTPTGAAIKCPSAPMAAFPGRLRPFPRPVRWYAQTLDPYGVDPDLPEELQQAGREYFARSPGSDVWVLREGRRRCLNACGQPLENAIFKTSLTSPAH